MDKSNSAIESDDEMDDESESDGAKVTVDVMDRDETAPEAVHEESGRPRWRTRLVVGAVLAVTAGLVVTSVGLWNEHTAMRENDALGQRYLQSARQGVLDLTSISADTVDADTARILAESTGGFRDDFDTRAADFVTVVKQANVKAVGSITEAGLESMDGGTAKVLVAATSKVTNSSGAQEEPRVWRLRVTLTDDAGALRMSDVEFVP